MDIYKACGGCTNKYGYKFDKNVAPSIKALAESYGCSAASTNAVAVSALMQVHVATVFTL